MGHHGTKGEYLIGYKSPARDHIQRDITFCIAKDSFLRSAPIVKKNNLDSIHIGGGGVNGSEGSVDLVAEGEKKELDRAIKLIESIKGKPPLRPKKSLCTSCLPTAASTTKSPGEQFAEEESNHCMFQSNKEKDLPSFFKRGTNG